MFKKYRKLTLFLSLVLVIAIGLYVFRFPLLLGIGNFLIINDKLQKADLIKVMERGPERVNYALQLYKKGYGKYILFSGSEAKIIGFENNWPTLAKQYAVAQGIPTEAIILGGLTMSTYDEAVNLRKIMEQHDFHTAIVVSSPPHMRRVTMTFDRVVKSGKNNIKLIYSSVPLKESEFTLNGWWKDEKSLVTVVNEYLKIAYYYFKYFI